MAAAGNLNQMQLRQALPSRGRLLLLLQEVQAYLQAEDGPENTDKLGEQMQNPKSIFTSNKSPVILQLTAMRILTCYGVGTDQYL